MKNNDLGGTPSRRSRWGQDRRLEFIDTRLFWDGRINRTDLVEFFGISVPQASLDLGRYTELAPTNLRYDASQRTYLTGDSPKPLFADTSSARYLAEVYALSTGVLAPELSFLGAVPPTDVVRSPARPVAEPTLRAVVDAIRSKAVLRLLYQSMTYPKPIERDVAPHSLAYDGQRWHVRAYCLLRNDFRDFVLARVLAVAESTERSVRPPPDEEWETMVDVLLAPHPALSEGQRRAVVLDYGMTDGHVVVPVRKAMVLYFLRRLSLLDAKPEARKQHVVCTNLDTLVSAVPSLRAVIGSDSGVDALG